MILAAVLVVGLCASSTTTGAQQIKPCSQPHMKVDFVTGEQCPKPAGGSCCDERDWQRLLRQ